MGSETCEESLNQILHWTGVTFFLATICACSAEAARSAGCVRTVHFMLSPMVLLCCLLLGQLFAGLSWTVRSSPSQCGAVLWEVCNIVYKVIPSITVLVGVCGPFCVYCCLGAAALSELQ